MSETETNPDTASDQRDFAGKMSRVDRTESAQFVDKVRRDELRFGEARTAMHDAMPDSTDILEESFALKPLEQMADGLLMIASRDGQLIGFLVRTALYRKGRIRQADPVNRSGHQTHVLGRFE